MAALDALLRYLRKENGSDLHLAAGLAPRVRVRGLLQEIPGLAVLEASAALALLQEVCDPVHWDVFVRENDVDFAYSLEGAGRFRVNCFQQENGPSAVFRLIPETVTSLASLGVPPALEQLASLRSGLVLVTGPTGSGKSTTLAAIVDRINETSARHIITIEDPIEFLHQPKRSVFSQREVGQHADSFAGALRAAIRSDADVILVGELRDPETISLGLLAAEMGCLVLSTLHTNSAAKSIDRLIDAFAAEEHGHVRLMLSEALAAVVAQILLPTADGRGRVPVNEILLKTSALPTLIRDNNVPMMMTLMQSSRALGMQTMDDGLEQLVTAGVVRLDDALRRAVDRTRFEKLRPEQSAP
ncbi:MAG: PilT/PilU family type 4a pilus ATPase [Deltaproteobacteria bacterium]|nr:PilT/PilU family type 4a pilus ATPase [Deltaproteobacteria bacterium]